MGKYTGKFIIDDVSIIPTRLTSFCLLAIANELAEANELKRNELNFTIKEFMETPLKDKV